MKKQFLLFASIFLFAVSILSAQQPQMPKTISGGVLNGKASALAKPEFPAAARAVNAEGVVNVQITIDEAGNVISALAVSGHPLLRQSAEQAALQSKFRPTQLSGQPVKVTGVIVYNFTAGKSNWFKVGYDLMSVQHSPTLRFLNTNSISEFFPAEWASEKQQIERLAEIKQAETSGVSQPVVISERKISETTEKTDSGMVVKKVITEQAVKSDNQINGEQLALAQSLIASLQGRLAGDELSLWQFNLGSNLNKALANVRKPSEKQWALATLRGQIQSAPNGVSSDYVTAIQEIVTILDKPNPMADDRAQIGRIMPRLFKN